MKTLLSLLICLFLINPVFGDDRVLSISFQQNDTFFKAILPEILKKTGYELKEIEYPEGRNLHELNAGHLDMQGLRLAVVQEDFPNIIKMDEPVQFIEFIALTLDPSIEIQSWKDLTPYTVGYPHGWKIFEKNVPPLTKVYTSNKQEQLFEMLKAKRVELILLSKPIAQTLLQKAPVKGIRFLEPALYQKPSFLFFHHSNRMIAKEMALALRELKADGTYQKIYNQVYSGF